MERDELKHLFIYLFFVNENNITESMCEQIQPLLETRAKLTGLAFVNC